MMREPSWALADSTMEGDEYASEVTQVQCIVYDVRKMHIMATKPCATSVRMK